jgi:hypothetical protein
MAQRARPASKRQNNAAGGAPSAGLYQLPEALLASICAGLSGSIADVKRLRRCFRAARKPASESVRNLLANHAKLPAEAWDAFPCADGLLLRVAESCTGSYSEFDTDGYESDCSWGRSRPPRRTGADYVNRLLEACASEDDSELDDDEEDDGWWEGGEQEGEECSDGGGAGGEPQAAAVVVQTGQDDAPAWPTNDRAGHRAVTRRLVRLLGALPERLVRLQLWPELGHVLSARLARLLAQARCARGLQSLRQLDGTLRLGPDDIDSLTTALPALSSLELRIEPESGPADLPWAPQLPAGLTALSIWFDHETYLCLDLAGLLAAPRLQELRLGAYQYGSGARLRGLGALAGLRELRSLDLESLELVGEGEGGGEGEGEGGGESSWRDEPRVFWRLLQQLTQLQVRWADA